jgi:hypothetical protein
VPRRTFEVRGKNEIAAVFDHLSQGEHELQVRLLRPTLAVWTIPDLCVPPTGVLADPRLSPIDLRAALRATRVTVRSERGDELAEPSFRLFRGDERTLWFRSHSLDPAVGLLLPEGWGIEVGHADHLATAVRQPSPVEDVRLRAGMRVRLHADGIALPAGYALVGRMRDPEGRSSARLAFDAMGSSGVVTTEALGPHHVVLSLRGEAGGQARYHRIRPDLAVDVLDARGVQDLVLPVDQASIDAAAEDER